MREKKKSHWFNGKNCFFIRENLFTQICTIILKMPLVANEAELLLFESNHEMTAEPHHNNIKAPLLSVRRIAMKC